MITQVTAKGMKGLDFTQDLSKYNLFIGPMGSGKSARTDAIMLVLNGYVPGVDKKNPDILQAFTKGDGSLTVGVKINGSLLERTFKTTSKGTVTQTYRDSGGNKTKAQFIESLALAGNHKILDLATFMELSDAKKIDMIFDLYPPGGDVGDLNDKIQKQKDKKNNLLDRVRICEQVAAELIAKRAKLELPAGTLAENTNEIEKVNAELKLANEHLQKLQREEAAEKAREKAEAKAKQEAEDKAKAEAEALKASETANNVEKTHTSPPETGQSPPERHVGDPGAGKTRVADIDTPNAEKSINLIIKAIQSVGCPVCATGAGYLVAKRELNRYQNRGGNEKW